MSLWKDEKLVVELCGIVEDFPETIYINHLGQRNISLNDEINAYLSVLFDKPDYICICNDPADYFFIRRDKYNWELGRLLAINPTNQNSPTRKNSDLTAYRNFLIEFDDISIKEQFVGITNVQFPYSTITYSGNKSLHFILSLENGLGSEKDYYYYAKWIHTILSRHVGQPDNLTKSPSFLTRFPNILADNGFVSQKLLVIKERVNNRKFISWLNLFPECEPKAYLNINKNESIKPERKTIIKLIDWYVYEYLKDSYEKSGKWFQCPICLSVGKSHYGKRLCIDGANRYINCLSDKSHNQELLTTLWKLRAGGK